MGNLVFICHGCHLQNSNFLSLLFFVPTFGQWHISRLSSAWQLISGLVCQRFVLISSSFQRFFFLHPASIMCVLSPSTSQTDAWRSHSSFGFPTGKNSTTKFQNAKQWSIDFFPKANLLTTAITWNGFPCVYAKICSFSPWRQTQPLEY